MALLKILEYPDPRLRTVAAAVKDVDERIRKLIDDMFETMYAAPGIGLAATQVDVHERVIVMDLSDDQNQALCFVNPEIIKRDGQLVHEEGCLSVPGVYEPVQRSEQIVVRALDREGNSFEMDAEALLAVCIQHEMDHLDGKLFVDYLSELKRQRLRKKLAKQKRQETGESSPARRII
jgi:peptide deformylase